ncbi:MULTISPECIES: head GIN domain-containing protein [unclassified Carboxylicivirga]|uniref:head GIN domain-containing protein n=1 Tax=Carboxylicivirga TaxID=1628153 RepID=UPI003D34E487
MRNIALMVMALLFTSVIAGQEKELRSVSEFVSVDVSSGIDLYYTQASETKVEVVCSKDDLHRLITKVQGNTLKVYMEGSSGWNWITGAAPKVYVSAAQLENLSASGGADVYGQNVIKGASVTLNASGGADIYMELRSRVLTLISSGGADIKVKGQCDQLEATASGGSDIHARELKAQKVKVTTSGGAEAIVWAEKEIIAKASGGSDIDYYGKPDLKELNESGAGDISQR